MNAPHPSLFDSRDPQEQSLVEFAKEAFNNACRLPDYHERAWERMVEAVAAKVRAQTIAEFGKGGAL